VTGARSQTPRLAVGALLLAALVLVVILASGGSDGHRVQMTVPGATGLIKGFDVRLAGKEVGTVKSVDLTDDYRAKIVLEIDDAAWPLPADTGFTLRQAGTIHFSDRYVQIDRGRSTAMLPDGATIAAARFVNPVEFDDLFNAFDGKTRASLTQLLTNAGRAAPGVRDNLKPALKDGPAAARSTSAILRQLGDDPAALDVLLRSTANVADAAATANPGLGALVQSAAQTFQAVGARSRQLETVLDQAPSTLAAARGTASKVDATLKVAQDLTDKLDPGVDQLRAVSPPLSHLLKTVVDVGPDARRTLSTLDRAAPDLNGLVDRVKAPLLPKVQSIGAEAAKQLDCIRPYSPEIAGLAVNWAAIWGAAGDSVDKIFRAQVGAVPYPNEIPVSSGTVAALLPKGALRMAFPRPPGQLVNKSWFQPQCNITADALDINKDPEYQIFDPLSKKIIDLDSPPAAPSARSAKTKAGR
jgi:ABC-type transporter Mla subunit MlaD